MLPNERFEAWQKCHRLVLHVYALTAKWPRDEKYGLTAQCRRSAYSAAANIAEGSARRGAREFRRFLDISLGSLSELAYCLRLGHDLRYITKEQWARADALRDEAGRLTWALYRRVAQPLRRQQ